MYLNLINLAAQRSTFLFLFKGVLVQERTHYVMSYSNKFNYITYDLFMLIDCQLQLQIHYFSSM